jgi:hypothetical protein
VHALEPQLVPGELREPVDERRAAHPQGLDLGTGQREARLEDVLDVVVVARLAVARDHRPTHFLGHR